MYLLQSGVLLALLLCLLVLLLPLHTYGPSSLLHHIPQCTFLSSSCVVMLLCVMPTGGSRVCAHLLLICPGPLRATPPHRYFFLFFQILCHPPSSAQYIGASMFPKTMHSFISMQH